MPVYFKANDRRLREVGGIVSRDDQTTPGAKDRILAFLRKLDADLPAINDKSKAQIDIDAINPHLDRLHALLMEVPVPHQPLPGRADAGAIVDRVTLIIATAREGRIAEAKVLQAKGRFDPEITTHGNVLRVLEALTDDRADEENAGEDPRGERTASGDAGHGAGAAIGGDGTPGGVEAVSESRKRAGGRR